MLSFLQSSMHFIEETVETITEDLLTGEVIDKDLDLISEKLKHLTSEQTRRIERIIDECIALCDDE